MDDLKCRFINAKTESERNAIEEQILRLIDEDAEAVAEITLSQIKETNAAAQDELLRSKLKPILPVISLSYIAKTYFKKSRSWLVQRINGNIVNGRPAKFSNEELQILDSALKDIAVKLSTISVS